MTEKLKKKKIHKQLLILGNGKRWVKKREIVIIGIDS
jgi:hypothetical protein